jgi:hypothetical protein
MERYLWIGKNTGIWNFMDRLDILLNYLPLFLPLKGEVLKELSDQHKYTILYDALLHYYIKKIKEANTEPIEMSLEDLFQFALNIKEAAINPGNDADGNVQNSKDTTSETTVPRKQGGGKGRDHKKGGGKSSIFTLSFHPTESPFQCVPEMLFVSIL